MEPGDLIGRDLTLTVQLPEGQERAITVHGSKPVMDLLVTLCGQYHLNPSDHVIELISMNQNNIKFKPSSLIGSLEAERVVLKPKRSEDNNRRAPNVPVATVRLMVNYRISHKAVVRVNPRVPLAELMPAVCEKCELDPNTTVLLRDNQSCEPLDLNKTLNDYGIKDLYAKDIKAVLKHSATPSHKGCEEQKSLIPKNGQGEKNRGLLCLFRRSRKAADETGNTNGTPSITVLSNGASVSCSNANKTSSTSSSDMPKKRPAPPPPSMPSSQTILCEMNSKQDGREPKDADSSKKDGLSGVLSTESSLKRTKRKAPPAPRSSPSTSNLGEKERSYVGASIDPTLLKDTQESYLNDTSFDQYIDFPQSIPSTPLMTEILSEFMDRMKAQEKKEVPCDGFVPYSHQTASHSPFHGLLESDTIVPPTCGLRELTSRRDRLTTFTVVPKRKQQSVREYEFVITLKDSDSLEQSNEESGNHVKGADEDLEESVQENPELEKPTLYKTHKDKDINEFNDSELDQTTIKKFNLNENADKHLLESEMIEDLVGKEKDCVKEFRQKRKIFEKEDAKILRSKFYQKAMVIDELGAMVDKSPPTTFPVCWEEEDLNGLNAKKNVKTQGLRKTKQKDSTETPTIHLKENHKRNDSHHLKYPYWDVNLTSILDPIDFKTPHPPDLSQPDQNPPFINQDSDPTQENGLALSCTEEAVSKPKPQTSADDHSPSSFSLFALAVSQRVQSLRQRVCPLMLSAEHFSSPPPPHSVSQKFL